MLPLSKTSFFKGVLKHLQYDFADIYIFDGFFVSEIKEGVTFSWDEHAEQIAMDISDFTKCDGSDLVYLSHRIHSYSVVPTDWLKFYRNSLSLKGYGVIGYNKLSFVNTVIENLFFTKKIRRFNTLESGFQWAKSIELVEVEG